MVKKRNKKKRNILIGIIAVILLIGIFAILPQFRQSFTPTFTPIFCNDYEFTCCNENEVWVGTVTITDEKAYTCPAPASKCEVISVSGDTFVTEWNWFVGSRNCEIKKTFLNGDYYECDDDEPKEMIFYPGDKLFVRSTMFPTGANIDGRAQIKVYQDKLSFCGKSGCTVGVPVSGADGCKFNPDGNTIYTSTSSLTGKVNVPFSYTVDAGSCVLSWQSGNRHICGYLEESCSRDSDCKGHTYGNQECSARTLQTYGCTEFGTKITKTDRTPSDTGWGSDASASDSTFGTRCEIIKAETVQCCGDSDCGTTQFCDTNTFTCETDVQCSKDSDCGVSVQCDAFNKKLKTPSCDGGLCSFEEEPVECCIDTNCPSDSFCNEEYKCETSQVAKQLCPNECCIDDERYFDRVCPDEKPFCTSGICNAEPPPIETCESCEDFALSKLTSSFLPKNKCEPKTVLGIATQRVGTCLGSFIRLSLIPFIFIFTLLFGMSNLTKFKSIKKSKNSNLISFIVALILAGIFSYLTYILFWVGLIATILGITLFIVIKGGLR